MIHFTLNIVQPPLMDRCQELHDINHDCDDNPHICFWAFGGEREGESGYGWDLGFGEMTIGWKWVGGGQGGQEKLRPRPTKAGPSLCLSLLTISLSLWKVREESHKCFHCPDSTAPTGNVKSSLPSGPLDNSNLLALPQFPQALPITDVPWDWELKWPKMQMLRWGNV